MPLASSSLLNDIYFLPPLFLLLVNSYNPLSTFSSYEAVGLPSHIFLCSKVISNPGLGCAGVDKVLRDLASDVIDSLLALEVCSSSVHRLVPQFVLLLLLPVHRWEQVEFLTHSSWLLYFGFRVKITSWIMEYGPMSFWICFQVEHKILHDSF